MKQHVYVVQKINWEWSDEFYYSESDTPLKAFRTHSDAERYQKALENDARRKLAGTPPETWHWFRRVSSDDWNQELDTTFGQLRFISSMSRDELREKVKDLELSDFGWVDFFGRPTEDHLLNWWGYAFKTLKPEQWETFWALFDKLVFYEIVEVEVHS